jgi:hypothetical protein
MMSAPIITASSHTHAGTPPPGYHDKWGETQRGVTHTVHVHNFESLSAAQYSPEFMLLGNLWLLQISVQIYPGEEAVEGMVYLHLHNRSNKAIDIYFHFNVNDRNGKQVAYARSDGPDHFDSVVSTSAWRGLTFANRTTLLSSLVNGALVIEVHMKLATPTQSIPPPFIGQPGMMRGMPGYPGAVPQGLQPQMMGRSGGYGMQVIPSQPGVRPGQGYPMQGYGMPAARGHGRGGPPNMGGRRPMQPGQQPGLKFNNQVRNSGPGGMMMPQGGPGGPMMQQQHQHNKIFNQKEYL